MSKKMKKKKIKEWVDTLEDHRKSLYAQEQVASSAFEKWNQWSKLRVDWYTEPEAWEIWNGCVETMSNYFLEILCSYDIPLDEIYEVVDKAKEKFKS